MKRLFPACALLLVASTRVTVAQPPTGNAPKAANPSNVGGVARADMTPAQRAAADQRALDRRGEVQRIIDALDAMTPEQDREAIRQEQEPLLRQSFNQAGFRELALQDSVLGFVARQEKSRLPVREAAAKVYLALRFKAAPEEQITLTVAAFLHAVEVARSERQAATEALDGEIHFSSNPHLEALLTLNGVVGEASWLTSDVIDLGLESAGAIVPYLPPVHLTAQAPKTGVAPQTPEQKAAADKAYLDGYHAGGDMVQTMMKMTVAQQRESHRKAQEAVLRHDFASSGTAGAKDTKTQDALVAFVAAQERSRAKVRQAAARVYLGLEPQGAPLTKTAMAALLSDYLAAAQQAKAEREEATQVLDREIGFSGNVRLNTRLTMKGLIGEASWFPGYLLPTGAMSLAALDVIR